MDNNPSSKKSRPAERFTGSGGSVQSGLADRDTGTTTPDSLGMCTKGKNQVPKGPAKHKATGPFNFA